MTRHISDQRSAAGPDKTRIFFEIARRERGIHPATLQLLRRPRSEGEIQRLQAFARIERGIRA